MDARSGIYLIANKVNGKFYVGSAADIQERWWHHLTQARRGEHANRLIQEAWNQYGENNFIISVLEYCDRECLLQREQYYIDTLKPEYNLCPIAGSTKGMMRTQAFRDRMKGNKYGLGKKHTQEAKNKIAAARLGKKLTQSAKDKVSIARKGNKDWLGRKHTQESRQKMSVIQRAIWAVKKQQENQNA